jgi:hypothetical protein
MTMIPFCLQTYLRPKENHEGIIVKCTLDRLNVEQSQCGQSDTGYAMARCVLEDICKNDIEVINLLSNGFD